MNPADDIPQSEKRRILAEERRMKTLMGQAQASLDDLAGGRFAHLNKAVITGSTPFTPYPKMPEGNPWRCDPVPNEEPLGWSVEDQPPTGEFHELERSRAASSSSLLDGTDGDAETPPSIRPPTSGGGARFMRRI